MGEAVVVRDWIISEEPVQPLVWLGELRLLDRLGEHSWAVTAGEDDTEAVGRPVAVRDGPRQEPALLVRGVAAAIGPGDPTLLPAIGVGVHRSRPWLVSELDLGMDLRRFVDVIRPSPPQALLLSGDVLAATARLHAGGRVHTRLHAGNVQIGTDGTARLGDWAVADRPPPDRLEALRREDLGRAADLITALARTTRGPAGRGGDPARMLVRLPRQLGSRSSREGPDELLQEIWAALGDELARDELRAETAALVAAGARRSYRPLPAGLVAPTDPARSPGRGAPIPLIRRSGPDPAAVPARPAASRSRIPGSTHRAARAIWSLALALSVLGLVVGAEITFLHRPIIRDLQALRQPAPVSPPSAPTRPVPTGSVPPSGPLRSIDIRALQACDPGRPCPVRLVFTVRPQPRPIQVAWTFELRDRCSSATLSAAGGRQTLAAGRDQLMGLDSLALPSWPALELVARATAPDAATSAPLPVPVTGALCPVAAGAHP